MGRGPKEVGAAHPLLSGTAADRLDRLHRAPHPPYTGSGGSGASYSQAE